MNPIHDTQFNSPERRGWQSGHAGQWRCETDALFIPCVDTAGQDVIAGEVQDIRVALQKIGGFRKVNDRGASQNPSVAAWLEGHRLTGSCCEPAEWCCSGAIKRNLALQNAMGMQQAIVGRRGRGLGTGKGHCGEGVDAAEHGSCGPRGLQFGLTIADGNQGSRDGSSVGPAELGLSLCGGLLVRRKNEGSKFPEIQITRFVTGLNGQKICLSGVGAQVSEQDLPVECFDASPGTGDFLRRLSIPFADAESANGQA